LFYILQVRHPCSGYSCHTYAKCIVYYGRPQCVCNPGYIGDGKNCASKFSRIDCHQKISKFCKRLEHEVVWWIYQHARCGEKWYQWKKPALWKPYISIPFTFWLCVEFAWSRVATSSYFWGAANLLFHLRTNHIFEHFGGNCSDAPPDWGSCPECFSSTNSFLSLKFVHTFKRTNFRSAIIFEKSFVSFFIWFNS